MIGLRAIATYLPRQRDSNLELLERFELDEAFLRNKIGVVERARRGADEDTVDMAHRALEALLERSGLARESIQALVLVTQNPDRRIPHASPLVHRKAGLPESCATFDLSLGCSGYVYGLSVLRGFLEANGLERGVLLTCDPYSKIIDPRDKATVLLFGDAASATLLCRDEPLYAISAGVFGTQGDAGRALVCDNDRLEMNGRAVFSFALTAASQSLEQLLEREGLAREEVDLYAVHQGSKYIVDSLQRRMRIDPARMPFVAAGVGNAVSSSIPLLLEPVLAGAAPPRRIALCGFGVGLSVASCLLQRS